MRVSPWIAWALTAHLLLVLFTLATHRMGGRIPFLSSYARWTGEDYGRAVMAGADFGRARRSEQWLANHSSRGGSR